MRRARVAALAAKCALSAIIYASWYERADGGGPVLYARRTGAEREGLRAGGGLDEIAECGEHDPYDEERDAEEPRL